MLQKEEVEAIIAEADRLKTKKSGASDNSLETKKQSLSQKEGQSQFKVFFKYEPEETKAQKAANANKPKKLIDNNDTKPFYVAYFSKLDGENAIVTMHDDEKKDCRVEAIKRQGLSVPIKDILEYSKLAEQGIPDMVDIDELNSATLLFNLAQRYMQAQIYTYVGPILLVLNPFSMKIQKALFDDYYQIVKCERPLQLKRQLPPHTFAISALAYRNLMVDRRRQAIVISGESGAGKTESAKISMEFLTQLASMGNKKGDDDGLADIGDRILGCNPILEGFGNAKTVRNDNSSRFGKYVLMYFNQFEDQIYGARIKNYLLEKSRVCKVSPNERGYHIFYFLLEGAEHSLLKELKLTNPQGAVLTWKDFNYLKAGGIRLEDPKAEWNEVVTTMNTLGFTQEQIMSIWKTCAAILLFGQLDFDPTSFDDPILPSKAGKIRNDYIAANIASLLGIKDPTEFAFILLHDVTKIGSDFIQTALGMGKAKDNRDALAKQMYDNMFNWLVRKMNKTIEPAAINEESFKDRAKTIGLLDIFGFENFDKNNFEQLCINYVNEKLHKLYIAAIFEAEKMEMREEGLFEVVDKIEYPDLKVLEVIKFLDDKEFKTRGIFTIVDDQCKQRNLKPAEEVMDEIHKIHKDLKRVYLKKISDRNQFTVLHSAQDVRYEMSEFTMRNKDQVPDCMTTLMKEKTDQEISCIYQMMLYPGEDLAAGSKAAKTIWAKFSIQMMDLMNELAEPHVRFETEKKATNLDDVPQTELHFIRCIKPRPKPENPADRPGLFIHHMTLQQITYMGVLESVDLKQKNFPFRKLHREFYADFELLSPRYSQKRYYQMQQDPSTVEDFKGMSTDVIMTQLQGNGTGRFAIGHNKILMMPEIRQVLEKALEKAAEQRNYSSKVLKEAFTVYLGAVEFKKRIRNIMCIQARYKLKYLRRKKEQALKFQAIYDQAVINFKADRRQIQEQKAGRRIQDTLQKHMFRNRLSYGLKARDTILKHTFNRAYINRVGKWGFCITLQKRIVKNAFQMARKKIQDRAAWNVQRALRGHLARNKEGRMDWVREAIERKQNLKLDVSAKRIQKRMKGQLVRKRIAFINKTAAHIQAHFRMRWMRQVFTMIKQNTMVLQRAVRRYMARRDMIKERMKDYLTQQFQVLENVREMEEFQLFGDEEGLGMVKQHTPYQMKKVYLFSRVIDCHVITDNSDIYSTPWSTQYSKVYKDSMATETPLMSLSVGTSHTMACTGRGKTYVWGWNDNGQCAVDPQVIDEVSIKTQSKQAQLGNQFFERVGTGADAVTSKSKQILAVEDRCLILRDTNNLYVWGANEKGQLGLGHYYDVHTPTKLSFFSKQNMRVQSVAAGGKLTLASTDSGEAFAWPFVMQGQKLSLPCKMPFSDKVKISRVSCGFNFGFFISQQGLVYAVGKDNQDGQLGLGHVYPNDIPEIISCFKEAGERIDQIECGFRHAIAKSTLGKVYTWGWNLHGQLGHGTFDSELSPRQITLEKGKMNRDKAIQIAAGYSHSIIMTEANRDMLWFGTSGDLQNQSVPVPLLLSEKLPSLVPENSGMVYSMGQQIDFAGVKVNCSWSKTQSVTTVMIADLRSVNQDQNYNKIHQVLKQLSFNWDQREVMPPYIDVVSGMFPANVMRKPNPGKNYTEKPGMQTQGRATTLNTAVSSGQKSASKLSGTPFRRK